jgi:RimJ/RimL family protein N-acetyltransferase
MRLETARLIVRGVRETDAEALHDIRQRVAAFQGLSVRALDETLAMCAEMQSVQPGARPGWHQLAIELHEGKMVGDIGVNFDGPGAGQVELGYSLHPDWWGHGIASEAIHKLLSWLFGERQIHRIAARTGRNNLRSCALLDRLGFRREGVLIESWWEEDAQGWRDEAIYALLAREFARRD